jgi:hypothetical protein
MRRRTILAVAAASVGLTPLVGVLCAPAAYAADPQVTLADAPKVLGVGGDPAEFTVRVAGAAENARLTFGATPAAGSFFDRDALTLEHRVGSVWKKVAWSGAAAGFPVADGTEQLRISYANLFASESGAGAEDDAAKIAERLRAGQSLRPEAAAGGTKKAAPSAADKVDFCTLQDPGFSLVADLWGSADTSGAPVDEAKAPIRLGFAGLQLRGVPKELAAGGSQRPFTLTVCNNTDSRYVRVAPALVFARGSLDSDTADGTMRAADVLLDLKEGSRWTRLSLSQEDEVAVVADEPAELRARTTRTDTFRLGFASTTAPGPALVLGVLFSTDSEEPLAVDGADFRITAAVGQQPSPQPRPGPPLPDTGGDARAGLWGAALMVAGAGVLLIVRRRAS